MTRETTVSLIMGVCSPMKILTDIDITYSQTGKIPCERTVMSIRNSQLSYTSSLTSETLRFREMRIVAKLILVGKSDMEIRGEVISENLFQFKAGSSYTQKVLRRALQRLHALETRELITAVAEASSESAKQICLYSMMLTNKVMMDFMLCVVAEKYRTFDRHFSGDAEKFLNRISQQSPQQISWSALTIRAMAKSMRNALCEAGILDRKTKTLQPILIPAVLRQTIIERGNQAILTAFNDFE